MSKSKVIRRDWLKRQIIAGKIEIKCKGIYTDDYYHDGQTNYSISDWQLADISDFQDHDFTYTSGYARQEENGMIHWTMLHNHYYDCRLISDEQAEAYRQAKLATTPVDNQGDLTGFEGVEADEIKELITETIAEHTEDEQWRLSPEEQLEDAIAEGIVENTPHAELGQFGKVGAFGEVGPFGKASEYVAIDKRIKQETSTQPREERMKLAIKASIDWLGLGLNADDFFNIEFQNNKATIMATYSSHKANQIIKAGFPLKVEESGWLTYDSYHLRIILT